MPDGAAPAPETTAPAEAPPEPTPEEWERRFTYLYADFENYRRRAERDREAIRLRSEAEVLRGVLPLFEAAERAVEAVQKLPPHDPVRRGVEMLRKAFATFLADERVRTVAEVGEPFNPDEHEAVGEAPEGRETPDGSIATVVQQGFASEGGLLRPAKVIVARRRVPTPTAAPEADSADDDKPPRGE